MPAQIRVFISSPGDVRDAREAAAQTIEGLAPDYRRHFELVPYMWESEVLLASGHFQDFIEPPSDFDIVVLILWSRLGTLMPEQTSVRRYEGIDGRVPVTGAEWEFENALKSAREHARPDLLVYRSAKPATVDPWDSERRQEALEQLASLDRFWSRHFANEGRFIAAYHRYTDLDEFAADFGAHLRQLLDRRIAATRDVTAAAHTPRVWVKSPFRGLDLFEFEDAPVYFGRSKAVGKALAQLIDNAAAGRAFLLILGASGSGKSSLVKAGLAPRLILPRRVVGRGFPRRVVFRVGDRSEPGADLFDVLAAAIVAAAPGGVGLPEAGRGERLARLLRDAPQQAPLFLEAALDQVTDALRKAGSLLSTEVATLVLIVDQLEQLFSSRQIEPAHRAKFVALLEALARSGRVWVIATMRSDLWHRAAETPELVHLAEGTGRFDLLAPGGAEIAQMIRLPAQAAGLEFELDSEEGVTLDQKIAEEATLGPGVLPLLSYLLDQLYRADAVDAGGSKLTFATYRRLGGLKGAVAERAEQIFLGQTEAVRAALRTVIFALVQVSEDEFGGLSVTARKAELASFAERPDALALIEAYLDPRARLLLADEDAGGGVAVRVCHEALFKEWKRARDCIAEDLSLLAIRRRIEDRFGRWRVGGQRLGVWDRLRLRPDPNLLTDVDLADASRLLKAYGADLPSRVADYVERSQRSQQWRDRLGVVLLSTVALTMTVLAAVALNMADVAHRQARAAQIQLLDRNLLDGQADGDELMKAHNYPAAEAQYEADINIARTLVTQDPSDAQWRLNLAGGDARLGFALRRRNSPGDQEQAKADFAAAARLAASVGGMSAASPRVHADSVKLQSQLTPFLK